MGNDESKRAASSQGGQQGESRVARSYLELVEQTDRLGALAHRYPDPRDHSYFTFSVDPPKADELTFQPLWRNSVAVIVTKVPTLPEFWECRLDGSGMPFYINHKAKTTQWNPPWAIPYPPVLKSPPLNMVKKLSFKQWTWAYEKIVEAFGEFIPKQPPKAPSPQGEAPTAPVLAGGPDTAVTPVGPPAAVPEDKESDVCVVCMERKPAIVLACTHAFCNECLSQWKGKSDTCPLCRSSVSKTEDESWVLASAPTDEELASYVSHFIEAASAT